MQLFHKGKRIFYVEKGPHLPDGKFKPEMVVDFPDDEGKKLHLMFPKELLSIEDAKKPFATEEKRGPGRPAKEAHTDAPV
jgi:hypothetical protein